MLYGVRHAYVRPHMWAVGDMSSAPNPDILCSCRRAARENARVYRNTLISSEIPTVHILVILLRWPVELYPVKRSRPIYAMRGEHFPWRIRASSSETLTFLRPGSTSSSGQYLPWSKGEVGGFGGG